MDGTSFLLFNLKLAGHLVVRVSFQRFFKTVRSHGKNLQGIKETPIGSSGPRLPLFVLNPYSKGQRKS